MDNNLDVSEFFVILYFILAIFFIFGVFLNMFFNTKTGSIIKYNFLNKNYIIYLLILFMINFSFIFFSSTSIYFVIRFLYYKNTTLF